MKCRIYDKTNDSVFYKNLEPICGQDFCENCGDCLCCYEGDECSEAPAPGYGHSWCMTKEIFEKGYIMKSRKQKIKEYCEDIRWVQSLDYRYKNNYLLESMRFGLAIMRCCEKIERLEAKKARENLRIKLDI